MLAVRLAKRDRRDFILLLVRNFVVNNLAADNWTIIRYLGEEPIPATVWTTGPLPHHLPETPITTCRSNLELFSGLRAPDYGLLTDTMLARDPMGIMRIICHFINPDVLEYCHVSWVKGDSQVDDIYKVRWMFHPWNDERAAAAMVAISSRSTRSNMQVRAKGFVGEYRRESFRPSHQGAFQRHRGVTG